VRWTLAWLAALALAAPGQAASVPLRTLVRPCESGTARLKLHLGALPRGVEVVIHAEDGRLIGTAAPFALRGGQDAGIYQFALPSALFRSGRIRLRLSAKQFGVPERAPTPAEVKDAAVICLPP
jgi:hypothetical protein